jgi:hypothetical protein
MQSPENVILEVPPESPDITRNYLFYLHGLIVEVAGVRPKSEEHGYYEYELMLGKFAESGCIVISEVREKDTQVVPYAEKIVRQISDLLEKGVPPQNVCVVGASKGGVIGSYISFQLQEKEMNFVFLAGLFEKCLVDENLSLFGNVLSIHDSSDTLSITPQPYFDRSSGQGSFRAIVVEMGLGHGLIYQPYKEWMEPLENWLKR